MIKKTVTFQNMDGEQESVDLWFHISKDEIISSLDSDDPGALLPTLLEFQTKIETDTATGLEIMKTMREIISQAYCEREGSGIKPKTKEASAAFLRSLAFDQLLSDLITDADFAAQFIQGIFPADLEKMAKELSGKDPNPGRVIKDAEVKSIGLVPIDDRSSGLAHPRDAKGDLLAWAFRAPTSAELTRMNRAHLMEVMHRQSSGWTPPPEITAKLVD